MIADLIDRQAAISTAHFPTVEDAGHEIIRLDDIINLPTEPKQEEGFWIVDKREIFGEHSCICSRCGDEWYLSPFQITEVYKHCPHCGARMKRSKQWVTLSVDMQQSDG